MDLQSRPASYLPVYRTILHQLLKFVLNCSLEIALLISLFSKLASESRLWRTELEKHNKVRLWQSHIGWLAPVQAETLKKKEASHFLLLFTHSHMSDNIAWWMQSLKRLRKHSPAWRWWKQLQRRRTGPPPEWCLAPASSSLKACGQNHFITLQARGYNINAHD